MIDANKVIDPPPETPQEIILRKENIALLATIAEMQANNANDIAAHGSPPPRVPLKQIDPSPYSYEAVRKWAEQGGLIDAVKKHGRWFGNPASVYERIKMLMTPKG